MGAGGFSVVVGGRGPKKQTVGPGIYLLATILP